MAARVYAEYLLRSGVLKSPMPSQHKFGRVRIAGFLVRSFLLEEARAVISRGGWPTHPIPPRRMPHTSGRVAHTASLTISGAPYIGVTDVWVIRAKHEPDHLPYPQQSRKPLPYTAIAVYGAPDRWESRGTLESRGRGISAALPLGIRSRRAYWSQALSADRALPLPHLQAGGPHIHSATSGAHTSATSMCESFVRSTNLPHSQSAEEVR